MDTKFGTNVSNKMLLNAAKFQGYSSYRFWVIKGKPTGGGGVKLPPPPPHPTQIRVNLSFNSEDNLSFNFYIIPRLSFSILRFNLPFLVVL